FSIRGNTSVLGISQSDVGANPGVMGVALGGLGAFHGMISIACVSIALVVMRSQHGGDDYFNPRPLPPPRRRRRILTVVDEERQLSFKVARLYDLPPIHNDPLFWKEVNVGVYKPVAWPLFFALLALSLAVLLMSFLSISLDFHGARSWTDLSHQM